ncbi:MAG: LPS export ABC transporter permease LptG [Alphaproteobacteria bacterium]|nr:LPS export ABC transporter permease LptG [Alphaproteobacteria bacterium]
MSWSWTLYRYLALQFLFGVGMVYGGFLALAFAINIVALLGRTAGHGVDTSVVVGMAVLQLPELGQQLLPFAILGGGVFSFLRLARSQELVATRAAGVSAWDFLMPALSMAVLIGVLTVTVATPIAARMFAEFGALEARHIKGQASQLAISDSGVWLRQGDEKEQSVVHAVTASDQGQHLENVMVFLYRGERFAGRIDAPSAELKEHAWQFRDAWVSGADGVPRHQTPYSLATTLTSAQIQESFVAPDALSFWQLPAFIRANQAAGFSPVRYKLYFFSLCALPALFAAMVFMAASFSLRPAREAGLAKAILLSIAAGFAVYFFERLTTTLGRSGAVPVLLAATAPAIASILIGMTLVFSREDG